MKLVGVAVMMPLRLRLWGTVGSVEDVGFVAVVGAVVLVAGRLPVFVFRSKITFKKLAS